MSLTLNGTSQYVSLGDAVNIYQTRPWSIFAVIDSASLHADAGQWNGVFNQGQASAVATTDRGWAFELDAGTSPKLAWVMSNSIGGQASYNVISTIGVTVGTGWWLVGAVIRDVGASSTLDFFTYRYNTGALTIASSTGQPDNDGTVPSAGDTCAIGAVDDVTAGMLDFFSGRMGWVAIFAGDLGNAGEAGGSVAVKELINYGFWRIIRSQVPSVPYSDVKLAVSFHSRYGSADWSPSHRTSSLIASPTYDDSSGFGERPPLELAYRIPITQRMVS